MMNRESDTIPEAVEWTKYERKERKAKVEIKTIVITGGPCAGKTSAMEWIRRDIAQKGYRVLVIPETATEFISGGVCPWTCGTNYDYQTVQMHLQREKERCFRQAAETMESQAQKILIVCDRGMYDNMIYMTKKEFYSILDHMQTTEEEVLGNYDAVFHLVTAAIGTDAFATDLNNTARYEGQEQSILMDRKFIQSWAPHPNHFKVDSNQDFDSKMKSLINGITAFLDGSIFYPEAAMPEKLPVYKDTGDWEVEQEYPDM